MDQHPERLDHLVTRFGARPARFAYGVGAALFVGGVVLQVFFAGLGALVTFGDFGLHRSFGETLVWILPLMLATGLVGRLPWPMLALTALLFLLYVLQWVTVYLPLALGVPEPRALHAVNALAIFSIALHLARAAWRLPRGGTP